MTPLAFLFLVLAGQAPERPPLVATGWDSPSPRQFREGLEAFERPGVFEGTTLRPTRRPKEGGERDARNAFGREAWTWEDFAGGLADLQAAKPKSCRENPLMLYANPGDVDGFDDAGWREIVGLVDVPAAAGRLVFMPSVPGQMGDADACGFGDAARVEIPE